jgi:hypothetical protein
MSKIFLHVGLPKTGTTYLQNCFEFFEKENKFFSVSYPLMKTQKSFYTIHSGNGVRIGHYITESLTPVFAKEKLNDIVDELLEKGDSSKPLLISSEFFAAAPVDRINILTEILESKGYEIEIIVVVRPLEELLFSLYMQAIKRNGVSAKFQEWVFPQSQNIINAFVESIVAYKSPVHVLKYEKKDLLKNVLDIIGETVVFDQKIEQATVNRSLTRDEMQLMVSMNAIYQDPKLSTWVSDKLIELNPELPSGRITANELECCRDCVSEVKSKLPKHCGIIEKEMIKLFFATAEDQITDRNEHNDVISLNTGSMSSIFEIIKKYEKKKFNESTLSDKASSQIIQSHVNKLRDLALKIEVYHLKTAMALMLLAKFGRPGGTLINSRVKFYEDQIRRRNTIKRDLNKAVELLLPHLELLKNLRSQIKNSDLEIKKILDKLIILCDTL